MNIKIRFNTDKDKMDQALAPWRVLIEGTDLLAEKVFIKTSAWTSMDEVAPGILKWHISCAGTPTWDDKHKECTIL